MRSWTKGRKAVCSATSTCLRVAIAGFPVRAARAAAVDFGKAELDAALAERKLRLRSIPNSAWIPRKRSASRCTRPASRASPAAICAA